MAGRVGYYGNIVRNGLVLHLDAGKRDSYNRIGTTWTDLSKNGNNGTLTNGPTFNSNNGGNINFDGSDDFVTCGTNSSTMLTTTGTLSVWAKINDYTNIQYWGLAGRGASSGFDTNGYTIWFYSGYPLGTVGTMYADISNRSPIERTHSGLAFGTSTTLGTSIHNYTMAWDLTGLSIYLDGVFINSTSYVYGAGDTTTIPFYIGRGPSSRYSNATVYNTLLYNRRLSTTEVLQNHNALKGRYNL
jgi:hypothetical protein